MIKCPLCGSEDVTKLKTGSYRCNSCGVVFYPSEEVIIDMRDLIEPDMLTEEEINILGEKMKDTVENLTQQIFEEDVKNIFSGVKSIEEILSQYSEEEQVYGIFMDFKGTIGGTLFMVITQKDAEKVKELYSEKNTIISLYKFGDQVAQMFKEQLKGNITLEEIDIAYDTIPSMMNYILSEVGRTKNNMFLNVRLMYNKTPRGEILFVPQKESIKSLKSLLRSDIL